MHSKVAHRTDAENEAYIIVLGSRNSVMSRGINAAVNVSNDGRFTTVESSFGSITINNELVDPKNGFVIEGNNELDASQCKSGDLAKIIVSCNGKLKVRASTPEDAKNFSLF